MKNSTPKLAIACMLLGMAAMAGASQDEADQGQTREASKDTLHSTRSEQQTGRIVKEGIAVDFSVAPLGSSSATNAGRVMQGSDVRVQFKVTDIATGSPVRGLKPAGWIHPADKSEKVESKVRAFLSGSLAQRAEIDLNTFYVLAMNDDASISVIDPLSGYGGSKLLTMIMLKGPGEDWVLSRDQERLFVSIPSAGEVAVVDAASWQVLTNIATGSKPGRMALQANGKHLWVSCDGDSQTNSDAGVIAINTETLEVESRISTGAGPHSLALADDDRFLFVANSQDKSVALIDAQKLELLKLIPTGHSPASISYSPLAKAAYVVSPDDGAILVFSRQPPELLTRIESSPGLSSIRFAPGGRYGFIANLERSELIILDSSANRIIQTAATKQRPEQIYFSDQMAYVRSLESEMVITIPLEQVGQEGKAVAMSEFPAGQMALGQGAGPSVADGIVPGYEGGSMLVSNPSEQAIYYYREGMAAPMGTFKNYRRQPRAVLAINRSLREVAPGTYATNIKLHPSGALDLPFFLDSPRIIHCFSIEVEPDLSQEKKSRLPRVRAELLAADGKRPVPGESFRLRFKLTDPQTNEPLAGIEDLEGVISAPGNWHARQLARSVESGIYEFELTVPRAGAYFVNFQSAALNLRLQDSQPFTFNAGSIERKVVNRRSNP
jgi:DNA-binding beta-propeller fold protein YncE